MIIGLMWCLCAFLCIKQRDKSNKSMERKGIMFGIFFGFFGICGVLGGILRNDFLLATSILLAVALLCIGVFVYAVYNLARCKTQIPATYLYANTYTGRRGYRSFAPVFRYYFRGVTYERQTAENYSLKKLNSRFVQGQTYQVWINEKTPEACITQKKLQGTHILCLVIGILMLFIYMLYSLIFLAGLLGIVS